MPDFDYTELLPLGEDTTEYRKLSDDGVSTFEAGGEQFLKVEPEALTLLTSTAMRDIAHYLRPGHLQQLRSILDDGDASDNDHFVAMELLRNANIAAGGVLPMCQDTGTAMVMGKTGQHVFTGFDDEAAIARGVFDTYLTSNLRYSQLAPLTLFDESNTGNNLPAQIELYATQGSAYKEEYDTGNSEYVFLMKRNFVFIELLGLYLEFDLFRVYRLDGPSYVVKSHVQNVQLNGYLVNLQYLFNGVCAFHILYFWILEL